MEGLDDIAVAAFIKSFKGTCNQCGLYGHKGVDCNKYLSNKDKNAEKQQYVMEKHL